MNKTNEGAPSAPQGGGVDDVLDVVARYVGKHSTIYGYIRDDLAALAAQPRTDAGVPDDTKVICPSCCHQFRAIPVRVQQAMIAAGFEPPFTDPPRTDAAQRAQGGGEVVAVTRHDAGFEPGPLFDPNGWDRLRALPKGTKLYTAPPSVPVGERIVDMQHLGATVVLHFESHERAGRYYARHADAVQASENAPSTPAPVAGDAVFGCAAAIDELRTIAKRLDEFDAGLIREAIRQIEAAIAQPAACRCVDCGGDQPGHDPHCAYMRDLHGAQPAAVDEAMVERALAAYLRRQEDGESLYGCVTAALTAALAGQQQENGNG